MRLLTCFLFYLICQNIIAQEGFHMVDITYSCELIESKFQNPVIKSDLLPLDIVLDVGDYELLNVSIDSFRFNVICKSKLTDDILLVIGSKLNEEWKRIRSSLILLPRISNSQEKKLVDYSFPDMNTLYCVYDFNNGDKSAYLVRLTIDGFVLYEPYKSPFSEQAISEEVYKMISRKDPFGQQRSRH